MAKGRNGAPGGKGLESLSGDLGEEARRRIAEREADKGPTAPPEATLQEFLGSPKGKALYGLTNILEDGMPHDLRSLEVDEEAIAALEAAGLASNGMMSKEQWGAYDARYSAAKNASAQGPATGPAGTAGASEEITSVPARRGKVRTRAAGGGRRSAGAGESAPTEVFSIKEAFRDPTLAKWVSDPNNRDIDRGLRELIKKTPRPIFPSTQEPGWEKTTQTTRDLALVETYQAFIPHTRKYSPLRQQGSKLSRPLNLTKQLEFRLDKVPETQAARRNKLQKSIERIKGKATPEAIELFRTKAHEFFALPEFQEDYKEFQERRVDRADRFFTESQRSATAEARAEQETIARGYAAAQAYIDRAMQDLMDEKPVDAGRVANAYQLVNYVDDATNQAEQEVRRRTTEASAAAAPASSAGVGRRGVVRQIEGPVSAAETAADAETGTPATERLSRRRLGRLGGEMQALNVPTLGETSPVRRRRAEDTQETATTEEAPVGVGLGGRGVAPEVEEKVPGTPVGVGLEGDGVVPPPESEEERARNALEKEYGPAIEPRRAEMTTADLGLDPEGKLRLEHMRAAAQTQGARIEQEAEKKGLGPFMRNLAEKYRNMPWYYKVAAGAALTGTTLVGMSVGGAAGAVLVGAGFAGGRALSAFGTWAMLDGATSKMKNRYMAGLLSGGGAAAMAFLAPSLAQWVEHQTGIGSTIGRWLGLTPNAPWTAPGGPGSAPPVATGPGVSVKSGDTVWAIVERQLSADPKFNGLDRAGKDSAIALYEQKLRALSPDQIRAMGFHSGSIDKIYQGDTLRLSALEDQATFNQAISDAQSLTAEQKADILKRRAGIGAGMPAAEAVASAPSVELAAKATANYNDALRSVFGSRIDRFSNFVSWKSPDYFINAANTDPGVLSTETRMQPAEIEKLRVMLTNLKAQGLSGRTVEALLRAGAQKQAGL